MSPEEKPHPLYNKEQVVQVPGTKVLVLKIPGLFPGVITKVIC